MDLDYYQLLQLVDRLYRRHGEGSFPVGESTLELDAAEQLCGCGLLELHAHQGWPRASDLEFRALPAPDSAAPYVLVPLLRSGASVPTFWTANLTEEAAKLAYRTRLRAPTKAAATRPKPSPRLYGRWPFQPALDAGVWAPEQVSLFEELSLVSPSGPRARRLFGR